MMTEAVLSCDVAVIGSGSSALAAALTASAAGLSVLILEKTATLGGTTALSGAGTWVPANHHMAAAGIADTPEDALAYIRAAAPPGWRETEDALWRSLVEAAPEMLAFLEASTPLRFEFTNDPDPLPDLPGARDFGRMLSPAPLSRYILGRERKRLRRPMLTHLFTYQEIQALGVFHHPWRAAFRIAPQLLCRLITNRRANGTALVTGLLKGCIDRNCRIETEARVMELTTGKEGAVTGCLAEMRGQLVRIEARHGVVIATGGFEWDAARRQRHFSGPTDFLTSPSGNSGDGHRMAEAAGAALAHMGEANLSAGAPFRYDGTLQGISLYLHREPNTIIVDASGRRFANEHDFNFSEKLGALDAATGAPLHLPAWLVSDARLIRRLPMLRKAARLKPGWLRTAQTPERLAEAIGVPPDALAATIERFNRFADEGIDADFGRESSGRAIGRRPARNTLEAIDAAPFIAIPFNRTFVSTKGGPRTDAAGAVLRPDGRRIEGLYCAGVAMANPIGTRAVGAGTTIGPNLTWGYICGRSIIGRSQLGPSSNPQPGDRT
jgi:3-oxosteroid 1-dehydrogenase